MVTVGLTGGVATGKSTVARMLVRRGVALVDADTVAREVVAPGSPILAEIVRMFRPVDVRLPDGSLHRSVVRSLVSTSPEQRRALEEIMHPEIRRAVLKRLDQFRAQGCTHAVVEAALMVETGSYHAYDVLLVTTCSAAQQYERIVARDGCDLASAKAWVATQAPSSRKTAVADHVLDTECTLEELARRVDAVWGEVAGISS